MSSLSIIIVNWNSKDYVRQCLLSLERYAGIDHQTIVVDGASFDGCGEMIQKKFPNVQFVQSPENVGFGRCNNLGATQATGDFLLFLNPDTEIHSGAMNALLKVLHENPQAGLVGARLLNTDGTLQTSCVQALPTPLNQGLDSDLLRRCFPKSTLWGNAAAFASKAPSEVEAVSGACMLIRRDTFTRVGGFCPEYFMYAEDMHLCWEISKLGLQIIYQPSSVITHHGGGASVGDFSKFSCLEMRTALHHFISRRQGNFSGYVYRVVIGASAVIRITALAAAFLFGTATSKPRIQVSANRWFTNLRWAICPPHGTEAGRHFA